MDWLGLGLVGLAGTLLILLARIRSRKAANLRHIPGLTQLHRAFGLSVEDGTRLLVAIGGQSLLTRNGGAALAGLGLLREITSQASVSDRPPIAVTGESALALLSQDTLQAGYRTIGAQEYYQPTTGRLAGLSPFSSAAATISMLDDEHVSVAALIGHFGVEAALLADAADRSNVILIGATDEPAAQAALYASASEALIGEELFAAPAYFAGSPVPTASLAVEDILRWTTVAALLFGVVLRLLGLF